jgi:SAM-dependent methyltransferase
MSSLMQARRANLEAGFFRPFLQPGTSLIDVGCGQGTITVGLAEAVAPGPVLGFDLQADHLEHARSFAASRGVANVRFEIGDVYNPPAPPESFDAAYVHAVLMHLAEPERALEVTKTVLRRGGLIGVREVGGAAVFTGRGAAAAKRQAEIMHLVIQSSSGTRYGREIGIAMNRLCREAGFEVVAVSATWDVRLAGELPQPVQQAGGPLSASLRRQALDLGIATEVEMDELGDQARAEWFSDPDAFVASPWFEVVARKP